LQGPAAHDEASEYNDGSAEDELKNIEKQGA